ncbi:hypothetical protein Pcinc_012371 [Petrolisthes cinctipes]|uniref:Uncharacterized protein n=1 Tax=Petrolisthes cinctipes TaxID=88211 RepID=A0AAE1FZK5_PETCI|nr:hypothetical protein Pcinc_012371 [Petrolisthes cinctipes]
MHSTYGSYNSTTLTIISTPHSFTPTSTSHTSTSPSHTYTPHIHSTLPHLHSTPPLHLTDLTIPPVLTAHLHYSTPSSLPLDTLLYHSSSQLTPWIHKYQVVHKVHVGFINRGSSTLESLPHITVMSTGRLSLLAR